jgi:23S rRNA (uracil1939-C5)-methyltransferase
MTGKRVDLKIENIAISEMTLEGKGIARHEGMVIFVENCVPGDVVDIQVFHRKKNYLEARPVAFQTRSPLRHEPHCQHFGICGGCKLQHVDYRAQLDLKHRHVVDALQRLGKVEIGEVLPILAAPATEFYRNKLQFSFATKRWYTEEEIKSSAKIGDSTGVGFHLPGRFDKVLDIDHCYHQPDPSNDLRNALKQFARDHSLTFFDPWFQKGFLRNMTIRNTTLGEWMFILQVFDNSPEQIELVMSFLKGRFPQLTSLYYVVNPKGNDTFDDLEMQLYYGQPYIREQMENLVFRIGPKSFFQTNAHQAVELYRVTREFAGLTGRETVYDLYTGTGTIACFVAHQAKEVIGVEYVASAIEDAKINAANNGIGNTHFYAGDMAEVLLDKSFMARHPSPDVIITDPPRTGMHPLVVDSLLATDCPRIVYVSCNPATQARDLALLDAKYAVKKIRPVDMFPHTAHVENVALLELRA